MPTNRRRTRRAPRPELPAWVTEQYVRELRTRGFLGEPLTEEEVALAKQNGAETPLAYLRLCEVGQHADE